MIINSIKPQDKVIGAVLETHNGWRRCSNLHPGQSKKYVHPPRTSNLQKMAVATQMRPKMKTGEWSAIFPPDQVTHQQSLVFVKKLLAVAVSTITYLRTIFPEHAFGDRSLEDLNLKILRDDSSCPGACQVIKWMKGAFDALDKQYLRTMIIGMYTDPSDPDTAIETYTFRFSYRENGPDVDIYRNEKKIVGGPSEGQTKRATLQLLRTILVLTQSLRLLPDDVLMTMKLLYYDEVTPADYEPPGFKASDSDSFAYEEETVNLKVGEVATPFHTVKLRITTDKRQFDMQQTGEEEEEGCEEKDAPGCEEEEGEDVKGEEQADAEMTDLEREEQDGVEKRKSAEREGPLTAEDVPDSSPNRPEGLIDEASQSSKTADEEENIPQCACGCNEDDGLMIQCEQCRYWQHAVCFRITREEDVPEKHFCNQCGQVGNASFVPTDPSLIGLDPTEVRTTCLWRRALEAALDMDRVTAPSLAKRLGVKTGVAQCLLARLEKEGYCCVDDKSKRLVKTINKEKILTHGFEKYLSRCDAACSKPSAGSGSGCLQETGGDEDEPAGTKKRSSLQRKKAHKSEVERLTEQTADLRMSGRRTLPKKPATGRDVDEPNQEQMSQKKSQKRSRASSTDGRHHFELSGSQEPEAGRERKRRKASIVKQPTLA